MNRRTKIYHKIEIVVEQDKELYYDEINLDELILEQIDRLSKVNVIYSNCIKV